MVSAYDLSTYFKEVTSSLEVEDLDSTTFQANGHTFLAGFRGGGIDLAGFYANDVNGGHQILKAAVGNPPTIFTVGHEGLAIGASVAMLNSMEKIYDLKSAVSAIVEAHATEDSFGGGPGLEFGLALHDIATHETAIGNYASVDNGASSANGGVGHLHVTGISGGSGLITVQIQHSVDNITFAALGTFSNWGAAASERITIAAGTTVNRYVRAVTITNAFTSADFAVAFARR
jgi:hypothetical protein